MDSFFDMPAGYNDADMEMAALVEAGNRHAARARRFGEDNYRRMQDGETIARQCQRKDCGTKYTALVKLDEDGYPIYTCDDWQTIGSTAAKAYEAKAATA